MILQFMQLELFGGVIRWASARVIVPLQGSPPTKPVVDAEAGAVVLPLRPGLAKSAQRAPLQLVANASK